MLKYLLSAAAVIAIAIPVVLIFALGGGSGLPDAPACPAPTPIPYPTPLPGSESGQAPFAAYQRSIITGVQHLLDLRDAFRKQYPTDTFFREQAFRSDYAAYADDSICAAQQLLAAHLPAGPITQGAQFDSTRLDSALNDFIGAMQSGRDAVASRNTTKYQDWYQGIAGKMQAIRDALASPSGS